MVNLGRELKLTISPLFICNILKVIDQVPFVGTRPLQTLRPRLRGVAGLVLPRNSPFLAPSPTIPFPSPSTVVLVIQDIK